MADYQDVRLPDGRVLRFPAGMSRDEMADATRRFLGGAQEAPKPQSGDWFIDNVVNQPTALAAAGDTAAGDVVKAGAAGVARGAAALAGLPGTVDDLISAGLQRAGAFPADQDVGSPLSGQSLIEGASRLSGGATDYQGQSRTARVAGTVGEFAPGVLAFGGAGSLPVYAGAAGAASELAGEASEGVKFPDWVPGIGGADVEPFARFGAAVAAPGAANAAARLVTPNPANAARLEASRALESQGVRTTAGQRTGDVATSLREQAAPRTAQMLEDQAEDFTAAVLRSIRATDGAGNPARRAIPEVLKPARQRIGQMFDDLAGRNSVSVPQSVVAKADDAVRTYEQLTSRSNVAPIVANTAQRLRDANATGRPLTGAQYQQIRSDLSKATTSSNGDLRAAAVELIDALDDAMQQTLTARGALNELAAYRTARQQWRDYLAIERAAASAGFGAAAGIITPQQLRSAVAQQGRSSYATGQRDLGELARAGSVAMTPLKGDSGTPARLSVLASGQNATPGGLAGYALSGGDPVATTTAAAAGLLAPLVRNHVVGSRAGQAYLGNQILPYSTNAFDNPATLGLLTGLTAD